MWMLIVLLIAIRNLLFEICQTDPVFEQTRKDVASEDVVNSFTIETDAAVRLRMIDDALNLSIGTGEQGKQIGSNNDDDDDIVVIESTLQTVPLTSTIMGTLPGIRDFGI